MEITETVECDLNKIVMGDWDSFMDMLAEGAGHPYLENIRFKIVDHTDSTIVLEVTGTMPEWSKEEEVWLKRPRGWGLPIGD